MSSEVLHLDGITSPFNLIAANQDSHELVRVGVIQERQADVDELGEQFVKGDVLNFHARAVTVFQNTKEDPCDFEEDSLASDRLILGLLLINLDPLLRQQSLLFGFERSEFSSLVLFVFVDARDELLGSLLIDHSDSFVGFLFFAFDHGDLLLFDFNDFFNLAAFLFYFDFSFLNSHRTSV